MSETLNLSTWHIDLWCALKFCIALSVRAPRSMSVSPELDHFFLAKRRAGDRWPSADRAIELAGRWHSTRHRTSTVIG
jgi:hypothetical protein